MKLILFLVNKKTIKIVSILKNTLDIFKMNRVQKNTLACCNCYQTEMKWDVSEIISFESWNDIKYAVLILNRPITQNYVFLLNLWNKAAVTMTVDGGTKQWDIFLKKIEDKVQKSVQLPHLITGDFDSITQDILEKYKRKGCEIIYTQDQNHTDFTKALMELNRHCIEKNIELKYIVVVGQASGRIDQILGNIHTLFLSKSKKLINDKINLYLMADDSLSWLLWPGQHIIAIPEEIRTHPNCWCSLIPIGSKCERLTTSGLKWNLDGRSTSFGDLVSTSNTYNTSNNVQITCSHPILWSMKIPNLIDKNTVK